MSSGWGWACRWSRHSACAIAHRLKAGWLVTCGGCFNFAAGDYARAPGWMQGAGLEWLYRLAREPRRLFWRYAVSNPRALYLMLSRTVAKPISMSA